MTNSVDCSEDGSVCIVMLSVDRVKCSVDIWKAVTSNIECRQWIGMRHCRVVWSSVVISLASEVCCVVYTVYALVCSTNDVDSVEYSEDSPVWCSV